MEKKIWDYLFEKLNNSYGVAGLMGNLYVESHLNSAFLEGKYCRRLGMTSAEYIEAVDNGSYSRDKFIHDCAGFGLAQWTYSSRKELLYDYAKAHSSSIGSLDMQLDYMWDELQKYKTVIRTLYNATSVREASDIVALRYEKPEHTDESFLANRAKYGEGYYDKYAEGNMNTAKKVDNMLAEWKQQGLTKQETVVKLANACIGWSYVFGGRGEYCTPANRRSFYKSKGKETIKTKCKNFNGDKGCSGCKWYPSGETRFFDCRGFTYYCFLKACGITIYGQGATSQYDDNRNWSEKGPIANMPKDKVCCVFRYDSDSKRMEHTLLYDGQGHYIHCSGEVKKCDVSKYNATHYAIPKGLYDGGDKPMPVLCQAKVYAKDGKTVNMRSTASKSASIVAQIPVGTIVDVYEKASEWCKIGYKGKTGYMMTQFLIFDGEEPSGDTVTVSKADLETIYSLVGKMLGK